MEHQKPKLVMHIGLHKTGTTSIQHVCNNNRHLLHQHGIIYPEDREITLDTAMHLGLTSDIFNAERLISRCSNLHGDFVFLSNEGFSFCLSDADDIDCQNFFNHIYSCYRDITWVVSVRNDRDLLVSATREFLDGSAFPMQGIDEYLYSYTNKIKKCADRLKGKDVKIINLDDNRIKKNWPSYFLSKVFNLSIEVPDSHQNSTRNKSMNSFFSSIFRSFYHNTLSEHYYSIKTSEATERALTSISIDAAFESEFMLSLYEYIEFRVGLLINKPNYESLQHIFYEK